MTDNTNNENHQIQEDHQKEEVYQIENVVEKYNIPYQYYISGETISIEYDGLQFSFKVHGDIPDGYEINMGQYESPTDGKRKNLFVKVSTQFPKDSMNIFQRYVQNPCDIIHKFIIFWF